MTRTTNARIAGFTYLFYIAVAFPEMVLFRNATSGERTVEKLASVAQHATELRVTVLLTMLSSFSALGLLWLATAAGPNAPDAAAAAALGNFLLNVAEWTTTSTATLFAAGSTLFSYLLLRGRMIPVPLAWLGLAGSALLIVGLPLQLAEFVRGGGNHPRQSP